MTLYGMRLHHVMVENESWDFSPPGSVALVGSGRAAGACRSGQAATPTTRWTKTRWAGMSSPARRAPVRLDAEVGSLRPAFVGSKAANDMMMRLLL